MKSQEFCNIQCLVKSKQEDSDMTEISIDKEIYDLSTELGNAVIKGAIKE